MLNFRKPSIADSDLYFEWANDKDVRYFSYQEKPISYEEHSEWFARQLKNPDCFFYLFESVENNAVGQVRIEKKNDVTVIGVSVSKQERGKGYATILIKMASDNFLSLHTDQTLNAYIMQRNLISYKSFLK